MTTSLYIDDCKMGTLTMIMTTVYLCRYEQIDTSMCLLVLYQGVDSNAQKSNLFFKPPHEVDASMKRPLMRKTIKNSAGEGPEGHSTTLAAAMCNAGLGL